MTDPGPEPGRRGRTRADEAIPPHARTVIFVGKSTPAKNLLRALVLLTALCEADPDACALLVGPFSDEDATAIAEVSARSRLRGRIRLLGVRTDVRALLQAADVLLLTSVREGLPGVVLEALAEGTPVVSSDLPGSRWIAEQTAGVELVGLEEPDSSWLRAMRHALGRADGAHRHEIAAAFLRSPFRLEETVAALSVLWVPSTSAPRPTIASVRET